MRLEGRQRPDPRQLLAISNEASMSEQAAYDYSSRQGVQVYSWEACHAVCKALAVAVAPYEPEIILPVGRGGYYPGTLLAHILQVEVYPVHLSRRVQDRPIYEQPQWLLEPPTLVQGRRVLIVDEMCGHGATLTLVKERVLVLGAQAARCAVLFAHSWGVAIPDYIGWVTDALVINPWDREIWRDGAFQFHPEYTAALALQGLTPDPAWFPPAPTKLAKEPV